MITLAIDSTGLVAGAALVSEEKVIAEFAVSNKMTHSETLLPLIDSMFSLSDIDKRDVDFISCAAGPGSFTGLRIGAAVAKGLAFGLVKKIVPVPTLDALAYNISEHNKLIVPIMDARRNQVYTAVYGYENNILTQKLDYTAMPISDLLEYVASQNRPAIFLGDGTAVHKKAVAQYSEMFSFAPQNMNAQSAASVGIKGIELFAEGKAVNPADFAPFYLRLSQAEREFDEKK